MTSKIFVNGVFFEGSDLTNTWERQPNSMVVKGAEILHVGVDTDAAIQSAIQSGGDIIDLNKRIVVPGFIDAHVHMLFFGLSLLKLDLEPCRSLEEIRETISRYAKENPEQPRILCRGWQQFITKGKAFASTLDDIDPRPIFVEALDLHSSWCNTAALNELPLDQIKALCPEYLPCDSDGKPTGLVMETAVTEFVWAHLLSQCSADELQAALRRSFEAYIQAGYTGIIDMAMDKQLWDALQRYRQNEGLPLHVAAHWFLPYNADPEERRRRLDEAIEMHVEWHPSKARDFCILGIKLINDGVVDGCTAALKRPYGEKAQLVHPIWPKQEMEEVVLRAAKAGMQCAIHAIGDRAVTQAVDCIAKANNPNGRHRIEHLEITSEDDAKRLGQLGITASVQPIHSDPARLIDYAELVGPEAWARAFPYREFLDSNACVALGSDAPTALHLPFPNIYSATTRKSASQRDYQGRVNPSGALTLAQAMTAATSGAAYSRFAESWVGSLRPGLQADFLVLDTPWDPDSLLEAKVVQTWSRGERLYQA
jgi:predicted amidohydrolase YtcJ